MRPICKPEGPNAKLKEEDIVRFSNYFLENTFLGTKLKYIQDYRVCRDVKLAVCVSSP